MEEDKEAAEQSPAQLRAFSCTIQVSATYTTTRYQQELGYYREQCHTCRKVPGIYIPYCVYTCMWLGLNQELYSAC